MSGESGQEKERRYEATLRTLRHLSKRLLRNRWRLREVWASDQVSGHDILVVLETNIPNQADALKLVELVKKEVDATVVCRPHTNERSKKLLALFDSTPNKHQVWKAPARAR